MFLIVLPNDLIYSIIFKTWKKVTVQILERQDMLYFRHILFRVISNSQVVGHMVDLVVAIHKVAVVVDMVVAILMVETAVEEDMVVAEMADVMAEGE